MRWLILLVPLAVAIAIFATVIRDLMRVWRRRATERELDDNLRQREQDAERLEVAIEGHVRRRLDEAVTNLGAGDVLHALEILEPLAKRLARHPLGVEAKGELAADGHGGAAGTQKP